LPSACAQRPGRSSTSSATPHILAKASQALAQRNLQLQATVQKGTLTFSSTQRSVHIEPVRWKQLFGPIGCKR